MRKIIIAIIALFVFSGQAIAEQKWVHITLDKTPIKDRNGNTVNRPVFFSKDKHRLTTGGEWIIPEEIKKHTAIERLQKENKLLVKIDVPKDKKLPGDIVKEDQVSSIKKNTFGIIEKEISSGVTR